MKRAFGLDQYAATTYSQNGEDGILKHIFSQIGYKSRQFLEFGFEVPECNAWRLMIEEGFGGLFIDKSQRICDRAWAVLIENDIPGGRVINGGVTIANINDLAENLPNEIDLLSVDVDGNDYWIWKALSGSKAGLPSTAAPCS